jgi:hypothetical protein
MEQCPLAVGAIPRRIPSSRGTGALVRLGADRHQGPKIQGSKYSRTDVLPASSRRACACQVCTAGSLWVVTRTLRVRRTLHRRVAALGAVVAMSSVSGCVSGEGRQAADVAADFHAAVASREAIGACALLAPETRRELEQSAQQPCDQAVLAESIPDVGRVQDSNLFGGKAQVRFAGARGVRADRADEAGIADTVFLAEFPDGWKVVAAACTPRDGLPYDCQVEGG